MTNFLDNIAARSLNLFEVIQPRLASVFEPPANSGGMLYAHSSPEKSSAQDEQDESEGSVESLETNRMTTRSSLSQISNRLDVQPDGGDAESAVRSPAPLRARAAPDLLTTLSDSAHASGLSQTPEHPSRTQATQQPAADSAAAFPAINKPGGVMPKNTGEPGIRRVVTGQSDLLEPASAKDTIGTETAPVRAMQSLFPALYSPQASTPVRVAENRREVGTARSSAGSTDPVSSVEPSPTIKIMIGRVDVRAIVPASPPRTAPASKRPMLSLDDYLKQRNGGQ
ncbi:MAG: hypothetical protein ACLGJB_06540 [Blastocatellia bacterium]